MSQIARTLPEPKLQSTKKRVRPVSSSTPSSAMSTATLAHAAHVPAANAEAKAVAKKKDKAKDKKSAFSLVSFWPVFVGIFLSGYVSQWQSMAAEIGVWGMRIAFPLTLLATHREIGIDNQMATMLPQIALYAQLPLEGLLTKITLDRGKSLKAAIVQLVCVHLVATLVLWLLSFSVS